MKYFSLLFIASLFFLCSFFEHKKPNPGWTKVAKLKNDKDSFLLAPVSYYYPWDVRRNSTGQFYAITDRKLTANDTIGIPISGNVQMHRTGDSPYDDICILIEVHKLKNDTLLITIPQGDGEWFCDFNIRVHGSVHCDSCEPGYPGASFNYRQSGINFLTTQQNLQLDKKSYNVGDSIRGCLDDNFEIWSTSGHWKGYVNLKGFFKTKVLCDTCREE